MVTNPTVSSQFQIEAQLEKYHDHLDPNKTVEEIFGVMERWILYLGPYQLFLNPLTREWFLLDSLHDDWKPIGITAGTAVFSLENEDIIIRPVSSRDSPGTSHPPLSTPSKQQKEMMYCPNCGTALPSSARFCRKCGNQIDSEAT